MELAHVRGSTSEPLLEDTIGRRLAAVAAKHPGRAAVQTDRANLTYEQLDEQSNALATSLRSLGLHPFDRLAVCLGNLVEYLVVIYACAKLGVILVPLNPAYTELQMIAALNHISAGCVILSTEIALPYKAPKLVKVHFRAVIEKESRSKSTPSLNHVLLINNSTTKSDREAVNVPDVLWYHDVLDKHHGQRDETHYHTVGSVLPHTEIKIVSRDNKTVLRGERGELLISGYPMMKEYWRDEQKTADVFISEPEIPSYERVSGQTPVYEPSLALKPKTWLRTGDEAIMQPNGAIMITGRIKDIIIRGGENIYPSEVESLLLQHALVSNVAVVGLPDDYYGEVVSAFIVVQKHAVVLQRQGSLTVDLREKAEKRIDTHQAPAQDEKVLTAEDICDWVLTRLSKNCTPKFVFWVSKMPLTASGKIEKYKLRDMGQKSLMELDATWNTSGCHAL
ncbi:S-dihydroxybenzoyltransferase [Orbilia brochopaga]|nr:S-dihydroxybenzoyltransferase [Drechslerella brochopaga]